MRQILCIVTSNADPLAEAIISAEKTEKDCSVVTFDLTVPSLDYNGLLDEILRADSVQVW